MHAEHNDTMKTSDTVLRKKIPLTLFERVVYEKELETEQNCNILTITAFLSCSHWAAQPETREPTLLDAGFLYRILSPTGLVSKLTDFRTSTSYIIVQRPFLLVGVTTALIKPIHGQG